jgi:P22 coat protein - gene protein 5
MGVFMPINTVKSAAQIIARASAMRFADKVQFAKAISKADASDFKGKNGFASGDIISINLPARFNVGTNRDVTSALQPIDEGRVQLALDYPPVAAFTTTSNQFATDIDIKNYYKRVIEPAVDALAQDMDREFLRRATLATFNYVGTPRSTVFDTDTCLAANQRITELGCSDFDNRFALLYPQAMTSAVGSRKGLFQSSEEISKQYKKGYIGTADGFDYLQSNLVHRHTNGTATVTGVTLNANMVSGTGTAVLTGVGGTNTVTQGTVLNFDGVNAVHPITKQDLGFLQDFVVTANATAAAGVVTVSISPTPIATGTERNVTAVGSSGGAVTFKTGGSVVGTRAQALTFHRDAFRMVSVPLILPQGTQMAAQETMDGLTIRVVQQYEVRTDQLITRLDALCGIAAVRPEWAVRIGG